LAIGILDLWDKDQSRFWIRVVNLHPRTILDTWRVSSEEKNVVNCSTWKKSHQSSHLSVQIHLKLNLISVSPHLYFSQKYIALRGSFIPSRKKTTGNWQSVHVCFFTSSNSAYCSIPFFSCIVHFHPVRSYKIIKIVTNLNFPDVAYPRSNKLWDLWENKINRLLFINEFDLPWPDHQYLSQWLI
jgi:hypothetical protein